MMNGEKEIAGESAVLLNKHFGLQNEDAFLPAENTTVHDLRERLKRIISYLLDKDMERLLQAMYRIDVSEAKLRELLATAPPDKLAGEISDLVIEREVQKAETRIRYREK